MTEAEPTLAGVCTFANGSKTCGSGEATDPIHVSSICGEMLFQAVLTAKKHPGTKIHVVGNRNASEDESLASGRASAVREKLITEYGFDPSNVVEEVGKSGHRTVEVFVQ